MTLGADILHIIALMVARYITYYHFNDIRGRYITYYWGWITLMTLGQIYYILSWLEHFNDITGRYITYYWGWITLMTLGADILHIIEVGSL